MLTKVAGIDEGTVVLHGEQGKVTYVSTGYFVLLFLSLFGLRTSKL
jgi:hypothetical protein